MTIANDDLSQLKKHFYEWLTEADANRVSSAFELFIQERLTRLEETLFHHIELTRQGFAAMDKRFEAMQEQIDRRFDAVDKRFESVDKRFESVDKRFELVERRFDATDKRFEAIQEQMNNRFAAMGNDLKEFAKRMDRFMLWSFSTTIASSGLVIAVLKLWPPTLS